MVPSPIHRYVYFIIVGWNNKDLLDECIDSITSQSYKNCKIVYVDNGSKDTSFSYVKKKYPNVIAIDAGDNKGFAIGNNIGIKKALDDPNCAYVAFLNTDAIINKDWVKTIVSFAQKHPKAASFQTPTLDYYDHKTLDSRGIKIDFAGRAIQIGHREPRAKKYTSHQVFGVNAAACIYTAEFLNNQPFGDDYFDSDLWMYLEDVDLAARAIMLGYENWLVGGSYAYHMGSVSSSKNPGFSVFHIYRNNLPMLVKNLPLATLGKVLPGIVLTDSILILRMLRHRDIGTSKVILKARYISIRMLRKFLKKRKLMRSKSTLTTKKLKLLTK